MTDTQETHCEIHDDTPCTLGEGPLWHPLRGQLYWFDIIGRRLLTREGGQTRHWQFDEMCSAAGWVDEDRLLIASERRLFLFSLSDGSIETVTPLEADNPVTRSNDGRADPAGGFWIGTMGKEAEPGAGAIWRFYRGELRRLFPDITISNSICFAPDGSSAYFTDTKVARIMRVALDAEGWPQGAPELFLDCRDLGGSPDGSVVDAEGNLWNAQWGNWQVACYSPAGELLREVRVRGAHASCPAFGGEGLTDLYVTTAREALSEENLAASPDNGKTFVIRGVGRGQAEHRVIL